MRTIETILTNAGAELEPCDLTEFLLRAGLRREEVAPAVRDYFSALPGRNLELGPFTVLSPESVYQEARQLLPSCGVVEHGFLTFAREAAGDLFVVRLASGLVYLLNHDIFLSENIIEPRLDPNLLDGGFPEKLPVTPESIISTAEGQLPSLEAFFAMVAG